MRDPATAASPNPRGTARRTVFAAAAALVAAGRAPPGRASGGTPVRIGGTGGAIGTVRVLAEACRRRDPAAAELRVLPNLGTSGGIAAVLEGAADIALAARPPNGPPAPAASLTPGRPSPSPRGQTAPRRPAPWRWTTWRASTPANSRTGRTARRSGWCAARPTTPTPSRSRPFRRRWRAVAASLRRPGLVTAGTDQDNADALEAVHGSFGAITLAQFLSERRRLSLFALDGVDPTADAVAAGRYPLSKTFCFVTRAEPSPAAAAFMGFVAGPEGGAVLAGLGQEPVDAGHGGGA